MEVDLQRKRIALTNCGLDEAAETNARRARRQTH